MRDFKLNFKGKVCPPLLVLSPSADRLRYGLQNHPGDGKNDHENSDRAGPSDRDRDGFSKRQPEVVPAHIELLWRGWVAS